ncbi:MAG: class I SAM-dependent methyltransferase [Deltaproteobacteria bacterium]|nr:class I SAM-dependent methyltransferase [Deltaproteobacteria bacterium]
MLAEFLHLCRHAPGALALKRKLPQDELYATLIERADRAGLAERRRALVSDLRGKVVEIGCGTGAMFPYYEGAEVIGIEPDPAFAAKGREAARGTSIEVIEGSGEALPLPDASMDAAVLALVLCSVPDEDRVCAEVARVVKPGGQIRLIEHVRSERRVAGALMKALDPLWFRINGQGCHLDRDPLPALDRAGLRIESIDAFQIWSAGIPAFPMRSIRAIRARAS